MTSFNQVILTGKVANLPRFHVQPDGTPVLQFPLELNEFERNSASPPGRNGQGQASKRRDVRPNLIHVVAVGKLAQQKCELQSGQLLLVKGRLNQRHWRTPEGRNRTRTEVIASELNPAVDDEAAAGGQI